MPAKRLPIMLLQNALFSIGRIALSRKARGGIAALLVWAFVCANVATSLHRHFPASHPATATASASVSTPSSAALDAADAGDSAACAVEAAAVSAPECGISERDCSLCDFAAMLTAPPAAVASPALLPAFTTIADAICPRPVPYFPARFCDRSAARAPPAA